MPRPYVGGDLLSITLKNVLTTIVAKHQHLNQRLRVQSTDRLCVPETTPLHNLYSNFQIHEEKKILDRL